MYQQNLGHLDLVFNFCILKSVATANAEFAQVFSNAMMWSIAREIEFKTKKETRFKKACN
jgi:hypothetical protein